MSNTFKIQITCILTDFLPFEQEALQQHNKYRRIHAAPPMTLDQTMCQQAAAYAAKLANMGTLMHSPKEQRSGQGENLSMGCSTNAGQTVKEALENWYDVQAKPIILFLKLMKCLQ